MSIKNEVCSVEYAKKFKELGLKSENGLKWVEAAWKYEIDTSLNKRIIETKTELVFGDYQMIHDVISVCDALMIGELFYLLPYRITLPDNEPFNSFRLKVQKSFYVPDPSGELYEGKEIEFRAIYLANYYCDTTECGGENAWFERTLFSNNFHDEKLADCLSQLLLSVYAQGYIKAQ